MCLNEVWVRRFMLGYVEFGWAMLRQDPFSYVELSLAIFSIIGRS